MWNVIAAVAIAAVASTADAGRVVVTSDSDSGPGSLRQAILDANSGACTAPCAIDGASTGLLRVAPLTPLPPITANGSRIEPDLAYRAWTLEISGAHVTSGSGLRLQCGNCRVTGVIVNGADGRERRSTTSSAGVSATARARRSAKPFRS